MLISVGGIFVIFAVMGICVFLAASVLPLFRAGELSLVGNLTMVGPKEPPVAAVTDEYRSMLVCIDGHGELTASHVSSGNRILSRSLPAAGAATSAVSFEPATGLLAIGRSDGTVQLGTLTFQSALRSADEVDASLRKMVIGDSAVSGEAVLTRLALDQFRLVSLEIELRDPVTLPQGEGAVRLLDYRSRGSSEFLFAVRAAGDASLNQVTTIRPLGGGKPRVRLTDFVVPLSRGQSEPMRGFVGADGTSIFLLYADGKVQRFCARNPETHPIVLAETVDTLPPGHTVTASSMALGGVSILLGDDRGLLSAACPAVDPQSCTPDGLRMVVTHALQISESPIRCIGLGVRDRSVAVGDEAGTATVVNVTSEKVIATARCEAPGPISSVVLTPKFDALLALSANARAGYWELEPGHPEASLKSLFGKVHYEGAVAPEFVYQSTAGEDSAEPKLSLIPLILGTIKATIVSMLFAAPVGILAAIYTSEFVRPEARRVVKPSIEMMASLPSVVLGFLTALVVAPAVAANLPTVLMLFLSVPLTVMFAGYVWQMIPPSFERRIAGLPKFCAIAAAVGIGIAMASLVAPAVESVLFRPSRADQYVATGFYVPVSRDTVPAWVGGRTQMSPDDERRLRIETGLYMRDGAVVMPKAPATEAEQLRFVQALAASQVSTPSLRSWLDGNMTPVWPGWFLVALPVGAAAAGIIERALRDRGVLARLDELPRSRGAILYALKFLVFLAAAGGISLALALGVSLTGLDSRDVVFGPFSQSNTLMVGIMMGFAIIPIIFTISEDAMRSVPAQLRTASLGAGATPWQTAWRIVVPVAASGIFSAVMIGLGRATGETMIVVMATGNTPSTNWNIFSGLRTLSANVAVELPEAAQDTTHYRILFLCGLVLFIMTFVLNTTAEVVRQRMRRRTSAL